MDHKRLLVGAACSTLLLAVTSAGAATQPTDTAAKGECHGVNACKGQSDCAGKGHSCAGKNACKGQGWKKMSKDDCSAAKGEFKPHGM